MKLKPPFRNFYVITGFAFVMWMIFFDTNDLITRYRMSSKLKSLEREKAFYEERIQEVEKDKKELTSNKELLEKFAREKYLMKKPNEDIFVLEKN